MAELQADGVLDEAAGNMRMNLMAAAQLAQTAAQRRREILERATRGDLEQARRIQAQLEAERVTARAELAPVHEASWWDTATASDIGRAYETAVTFRDEDQAARDAESRIRQELRDRYDIDVNETGADPSVVRASLLEEDRAREERGQSSLDQDVAASLVVGAEALEVGAELEDAREAAQLRHLAAEVEADAELSWDSAERREAHVAAIVPGATTEAAGAAWLRADVDQARHPAAAVTGTPRRSPRSKAPAQTPSRQSERGR